MCGFSLMHPNDWHPVDGWGDNISFLSDDNSSGIYFEKINLNRNWDFHPSADGLQIWAKWNVAKSEIYKREIQRTYFNGNEFYYGVFDTSEYENDPDTIAGFRNDQCGFIIVGYSGNLESYDFQQLFEDFLGSMIFDDELIHD